MRSTKDRKKKKGDINEEDIGENDEERGGSEVREVGIEA